MTHCNQCNHLSKEEALKCCAHAECPHKVSGDVPSASIPDEPETTANVADDLTLGVQAEEANENKSIIGKIADFVTGK